MFGGTKELNDRATLREYREPGPFPEGRGQGRRGLSRGSPSNEVR